MKCGDRVLRIRRITKLRDVRVGKETKQKKITTRNGRTFCINGCPEHWKDDRGHTKNFYKRVESEAQKEKDQKTVAQIKSYKRSAFRQSRRPLREKKPKSLRI